MPFGSGMSLPKLRPEIFASKFFDLQKNTTRLPENFICLLME